MVTGLQRSGGVLSLHVHGHTLVIDGVFVADAEGRVTFHPAPPPDGDVPRVVQNVRRRILTHLGLGLDDGAPDPAHPPPEGADVVPG